MNIETIIEIDNTLCENIPALLKDHSAENIKSAIEEIFLDMDMEPDCTQSYQMINWECEE